MVASREWENNFIEITNQNNVQKTNCFFANMHHAIGHLSCLGLAPHTATSVTPTQRLKIFGVK